ncbi:MAG: sugar nucleotide-binding protein, partial [Pirellulaceae bacterium]|nr:sugar nucleotide-binding protein [Pirellulaceae bacterium]
YEPRTPPLPLLITGVAGVAGYNALHYFSARYPGQVFAVRRPDYWNLSSENIIPCELHDQDRLARLFDEYGFAAVLNCEGSCALRACEMDPPLAWRVNVLGLQGLLETIQDRDVRLVHLSIDLVYSGQGAGDYLEHDPTDPVTVYGKTMVQSERLVGAICPAACVLRISLPMGVSFNGHAGAIDWIQSRFKKSKPATLYYDEIRTPTYTDCLNRVCEDVLGSSLSGLYHAGGPRRLSLYNIAQIVNRVGGYDPRHLEGCLRHQAGPVPPRAGNVALNSRKLAEALGYEPFDPWPLDERWVPSHPAWHFERSADQPGSPELLAEILYRNPSH